MKVEHQDVDRARYLRREIGTTLVYMESGDERIEELAGYLGIPGSAPAAELLCATDLLIIERLARPVTDWSAAALRGWVMHRGSMFLVVNEAGCCGHVGGRSAIKALEGLTLDEVADALGTAIIAGVGEMALTYGSTTEARSDGWYAHGTPRTDKKGAVVVLRRE